MKNMERHTNGELAEMYFVYGIAEVKGPADERIYQERFSDRRQPDHHLFLRVYQNMCDYGTLRNSVRSESRPRSTRSIVIEENILDMIDTNPSTSIRSISSALGVSRSRVQCVLNAESMHAFHLQRVQLLNSEDYHARVRFAPGIWKKVL